MAGNLPSFMVEPNSIVEPLQTPRHHMRPTARELRSQAIYRLQVGLFGLCAMLLIVGLANVIRDRLRLVDLQDPIQDVVAADAKPTKPATDPLADIGVVPAAEPSPKSTFTPVPLPAVEPTDGLGALGTP